MKRLVAIIALLACSILFRVAELKAEAEAETLQIGDLEILVIPDAEVSMDESLLPGLAEHPEYGQVFQNGDVPAVSRTYFFKSGDHKVLVDTGWGPDSKVKGNTLEVLQNSGIKPEEVTDILLTHMDHDHTGALLKDGQAIFPNANLWISVPEYEAWNSGKIENRPEFAKERNKEIFDKYRGSLNIFNFGEELFPGVKTVDASGHTPGHTAYQISSGNDKLLIVGDLMHIAPVQLPLPELSTIYDIDMEKAAKTRNDILEKAAQEGFTVAGMHFPMISKVIKREDGGFMMREPR